MSRIDLRPVVPKLVQCENCGRIRTPSGEWAWLPDLAADVIGYCATCGEARKRLDRAREAQDARAVARRAATPGALEQYGVADPFQGFREGE